MTFLLNNILFVENDLQKVLIFTLSTIYINCGNEFSYEMIYNVPCM